MGLCYESRIKNIQIIGGHKMNANEIIKSIEAEQLKALEEDSDLPD